MGRGPVKNLDKFKLRWHRASDHSAFNNTENVWANSCHGLPKQSDRKGAISGEEVIKSFFLLLQIIVDENRVALSEQQSGTPHLNVITTYHKHAHNQFVCFKIHLLARLVSYTYSHEND